MRRCDKFMVSGALVLFATSLFASEAYTPIAYGTKSLGMGGVGIATLQGAQSGFSNPALLSFLKRNEISVGVTYNHPDRKSNAYGMAYNNEDTYNPYLAFNCKLSDDIDIGLTAFNYKLQNRITSNQSSYIQKRVFSVPLSYRYNNFSIGASFIGERETYLTTSPTSSGDFNGGNVGYMIGVAYNLPQTGVMAALEYKSKIDHKFYNINHYFHLNTPSELGVGLHWKILDTHSSLAMDYKRVYSSKIYTSGNNPSASTWFKDQNVFSVGYSYDTNLWSFRAGYKYVSPLYREDLLSYVLPYESKSHYSIGGTYRFTNHFATDVAVVYSPYENTLRDGSDFTGDETSVSVGFDYTF